MRTLAPLLLIILLAGCAASKKHKEPVYRFLWNSRDAIIGFYTPLLYIMDLEKGDHVVSIGADAGQREMSFACLTDSIYYTIEDIDTVHCNKRMLHTIAGYYRKLPGMLADSNFFTPQIGTEFSTELPSNSYDKILLLNCFHHFTRVDVMVDDIIRICKPGSTIIIEEYVPKKSGKKSGCNVPRYCLADLKKKWDVPGIELVAEYTIPNYGKKTIYLKYRKL